MNNPPEPTAEDQAAGVFVVILAGLAVWFIATWLFTPSDEDHAAFQTEVAAYRAEQQKDIIRAQLACDLQGSRSACERYGNLTR